MPRTTLIAAFLLIFSTPVAAAEKIILTPDQCRGITLHQTSDDVAYKPGVDATGREVIPADLDQDAQIAVPETFEFPLIVELDRRLGRNDPGVPIELDARFGVFKYDRGRITFNGEPFAPGAQRAIIEACLARLAKERHR